MKTVRYLLSVIAIMGVLGVSAQTPKYGKPYQPHNSHAKYSAVSETTIPAATIGSVDAGYMQSGSNLPMAAATGTTTTYDGHNHINGPRRTADGDDDDTPPPDPHGPNEDPIGDAMWPMMMLALAYAIYNVSRMRRREEGMLKR